MANNTTPQPAPEAGSAQPGDTVTIDFKGMIGGVAFAGGTAQNHDLQLGSGQFIPGFEEQLIGAKPGEQLQVKVTFPAEYPSAEVAGKEALFIVDVKAIKPREMAAQANPQEAVMQNLQQLQLSDQRFQQVEAQLRMAEIAEAEARQQAERAQNRSGWAKNLGLGLGVGAALGLTGDMSFLSRAAFALAGGGAGHYLGDRITQDAVARTDSAYHTAALRTNALRAATANELQMYAANSQILAANMEKAAPAQGFSARVNRAPSVSQLAAPENAAASFSTAVAEEAATPTVKTR